jgi:dienelactone hydrolase
MHARRQRGWTGRGLFIAASLILAVALVVGCRAPRPAAQDSPLRVAVFRCDVTPPLGHPLCGGWIKPLIAVDDPLLAKGVVVEQGGERYVLCAVDWCLLQTGARDLFQRKLAEAADVPESHVSVHTVHQHNAPIADINAQLLLNGIAAAPAQLDLAFMTNVTDRVAASVRSARQSMRPVTQIGHGRARVERFASTRRPRLADGHIHVRYSSSKDPALQASPEGLIDPWLRTVTLFDGDQPLVRLHFYATHPMSYYGDGRATADTVGLAREQLEREEKVPQIYFTGCAGNITAGKYNDGSPQARVELTGRIHDAMNRSIAATLIEPAGRLEWKTESVAFAPRAEPEWSEATSRHNLADTNAKPIVRLEAALNLAWTERLKTRPTVQSSRLRVGPVTLLFLPGESFIEYQLYAQSLRPDDFVAVAAYGESGPGYICCDAALTEGGYEPTMSRVGPPTEWRLKEAINTLLGGPANPVATPFYPDKLRLLAWRDRQGVERPIERPVDWPKRRADILAAMQEVMGSLPPAQSANPPVVELLEETRLPKSLRRKILFTVEPGNRVPAYLFLPDTGGVRLPAVLCLHQTTRDGKAEPAGLGGMPNLHYAVELANRGYVTLAPDYPNYGDYHRDPYESGYASATMQGIVNHRRAVDLLVSLPEVDPHRVGVIGHSLGGHNALFLAAFDERVRAVVTSCGFNSFFKYYGGDLAGWSHPGYMPRIRAVYARDPKEMPFDFSEVLAAIAPRPVFVNAPLRDANFEVSGVQDCLAAAAPVYRLLGASDSLVAVHPDTTHDFPPETRRAAYDWLDRTLARK